MACCHRRQIVSEAFLQAEKAHKAELSAKVRQLEKQNVATKKELAEAKSQLAAQKMELDQTKAAKEPQAAGAEAREQQSLKLTSTFEKCKDDAEHELQCVKKSLTALQEQIAAMDARLQAEKAHKAECSATVQQLEKQIVATEQELAESKSQLAAQKMELDQTKAAEERLLKSVWTRATGPLTHFGSAIQKECKDPTSFSFTALGDRHEWEMRFLRQMWDQGGICGGPNKFSLVRIEAVDGGRALETFKHYVETIEKRRVDGDSVFNPRLVEDPDGEKAAIIERKVKPQFQQAEGLKRANLIVGFHGCTPAKADAICTSGFANVAVRDNGYYGSGVYITTSAQYACEYATGVIGDGLAGDIHTNGDGESCVLACWAVPGMIYPVTRAVDYASGNNFSKFYTPKGENQIGLKQQFNSHYVCIDRDDDYQCFDGIRNGKKAHYDEIVLKECSQLMVAYRLWFKSSGQSQVPGAAVQAG